MPLTRLSLSRRALRLSLLASLLALLSIGFKEQADSAQALSGTVISENNPAIQYQGWWVKRNDPGFEGGTELVSEFGGPAGRATLPFEGTSVGIVYTQDSDRGIAQVLIDDKPAGFLDEYGPARAFQKTITFAAWDDGTPLPDGSHTISIVNQRSKNSASSYSYVGLDALVVNGSSTTGATASPGSPLLAGAGSCGEPTGSWHPPVYNGCATHHEHEDAPPSWISAAGYNVTFDGPFNTSAGENVLKHPAMKGFSAKLDRVDLYFRVHAASNVLDRSARFHSYQVWARDQRHKVSFWQGWYNTGDPVVDRYPRTQESGVRPAMLVVDQASYDRGIRCEQWYAFTAAWSWDLGWTICGSTTLFYPGENNNLAQSSWIRSPDGTLGGTRRLEVAWYTSRAYPTGNFWATQFGELVSGWGDPRCSSTTTAFGTTYANVCLEQVIQNTMSEVSFPGNSAQKDFDVTGVQIPN